MTRKVPVKSTEGIIVPFSLYTVTFISPLALLRFQRQIKLCYFVYVYVMLRYVVLCYVMLCCVMLRHVMLYSFAVTAEERLHMPLTSG